MKTRHPIVARVLARLNDRHGGDSEDGSLILDILIGMAIFALIAIIAVSAIGQYRMRAYTQAAMSDAEQVANAVNAYITDQAAEGAAGTEGAVMPTGLLGSDVLASLDITPTGTGPRASTITVTPEPVSPEDFEVCVEYRGAYALYSSSKGGLVESGSIERDGFRGCSFTPEPPVDPETPDGDAECRDWTYVQGTPYAGLRYQAPAPGYPSYFPQEVVDAYNDPARPGFTAFRGDPYYFLPANIPGLTKTEWDAWNQAKRDANPGHFNSPSATIKHPTDAVESIFGAADWTRGTDGFYLDSAGAPVTYEYCDPQET